ncbi:MAG: alpha/beta hydrolase [Myxococcota bacterium]
MSATDELTLQIPGLRLSAKAWGPEDGHPVLALHGWLDNAASFDRLAPLLDSCRVVALDLPGHGKSEHRPKAAGYNFIDWVPDMFAALDELAWQRFALLAHSLGGGIACMMAGTFPERCTGLVLLEGLGPLSGEAADAPDRLARAVASRARFVGKRSPVHAGREAATARVVEATRMSPEAAAILVARGTREVDGGVTWCTDPRLRGVSALRLTEEQVRAFLARIACPTLLVVAADGLPFDTDLGRGRAACVPNITIETLDGGHHVHLDDAGTVARLARPYLAG